MAEQTFRSPGFFEREVDLTQRTREIEGVPAGIIGMASKGPAFVPITVGSFVDFERKFGTLNSDFFGPYAVNEWLKHRTALTYIRVLGAGANNSSGDIGITEQKGTVKNAGFRLKGTRSSALSTPHNDNRFNGSVQFIAAVHDAVEFDGLVVEPVQLLYVIFIFDGKKPVEIVGGEQHFVVLGFHE